MTADAPGADLPATCPSCGASVRQSVPWCLQCYASLRPEPEPEPEPVDEPEPEPGPEPEPVDEPEPEAGSTPRADVGGGVGGVKVDVDAVAERMLAELRASQPHPPGLLARVPSSRAGRAGAVAAVIAGLGLVIVLVLTVLGQLL